MKTLVLAEKKSQAQDLSKGLVKYGGPFTSGNRFLENKEYIITWAEGHVLSLQEPRDYDNWGDKKWELDSLPWYPPQMEFLYKVGKERVYQQLRPIFNRKDIQEIIVATDAGREGTLIAHELIDHFGLTVPIKRFYESAVLTPSNIQRIMENDLKGTDFIEPRKKAAYARAFADLLLGMNFTIGFTAKAKSFLSIGRVKTPTLSILAQRKKEILNFKEEKYFELEADFGGVYKGIWFKEKVGNTKLATLEDIKTIQNKINGKTGKIIKKEVTDKPEHPKLLFNLNDLQGEANSKFGMDPDETLNIAQELYDTHKILSYPRTESRVIGTEHEKMLPSILNAIKVGPYKEYAETIEKKGIPTTKRLVNDKELSDHHALIPTEVSPDLTKLNDSERKIYDLVVKRFLAAFYPPAIYEKTEVITEVEGETFKTSGRIEKDKGWKVIYGGAVQEDEEEKEDEKNAIIPPIEEGEEREVLETKEIAKKTSPPKLYTYKQLLKAMENPKRFLHSKELKDALDSAEANAGLGTSATRAQILKELMDAEYMVKKGKNVDITDLGIKLVEVAPERLKSPEITAEWEGKLRQMELGEYDFDVFMDEIVRYIDEIIQELKTQQWNVVFAKHNGKEIATCPYCAKKIALIGKAYLCESHRKESPCFGLPATIGKKKISEKNVKDLVEKGETGLIKGFTANSGKKFDAKIVMENKQFTFSFGNSEPVSVCPTCQKGIFDRGKFYACESNSKESPCFSLSKTIGKKNITHQHVKNLAEKGETALIKGFTANSGKKFDAKLKWNNGKVEFAFNKIEVTDTDVICPFCQKGNIRETDRAFSCSNWKAGCKFTFWKNGKAIQKKHLERLIQDGETGRIDGLKSKKGKYYTANFKLDVQNQKIDMEFIND